MPEKLFLDFHSFVENVIYVFDGFGCLFLPLVLLFLVFIFFVFELVFNIFSSVFKEFVESYKVICVDIFFDFGSYFLCEVDFSELDQEVFKHRVQGKEKDFRW